MEKTKFKGVVTALTAAFILSSTPLHAIVGYFIEGTGIRSLGMAGTAAGNPQEASVIASNPAGISFLQDRIDVGMSWFNPERHYTYTIPEKSRIISQRTEFLVPTFGALKHLDECNSIGIALIARGLSTSYPNDNPVFGAGKLNQVTGLDYLHMVFAPTYSRKIGDRFAVAISLLAGVQRIYLKGLQGFKAFSSSPNHVSNRGYDYAGGAGAQVGIMGQLTDSIKVGVSYASKVFMSKFSEYRGLLAEHGKLDIPAQFFAGISWNYNDSLLIAFDYQRIFYGQVPSLHHSITRIGPDNLGTNGGAGFGWNDVNVYKVGLNYVINCNWEARVGYAYGDKPYSSKQVDPNILAPAITQHHFSMGGTYHINCYSQLDFFYAHAFQRRIRGQSQFGLGTITEKTLINQVGMSYSYLF